MKDFIQFVPLGRVGAPFGILGWNHFALYADDPKAWLKIPTWFLGNEASGFKAITQKRLEYRNNKWLVQIADSQDRDTAATFEGLLLGAPLESLPQLNDDEFYWEELVGLPVFLKDGEVLGEVSELLESPANAVLVVKDSEKTHLLPFVESVVLSVSRSDKRIIVDWGKDW